jgi:hypothetical protein
MEHKNGILVFEKMEMFIELEEGQQFHPLKKLNLLAQQSQA